MGRSRDSGSPSEPGRAGSSPSAGHNSRSHSHSGLVKTPSGGYAGHSRDDGSQSEPGRAGSSPSTGHSIRSRSHSGLCAVPSGAYAEQSRHSAAQPEPGRGGSCPTVQNSQSRSHSGCGASASDVCGEHRDGISQSEPGMAEIRISTERRRDSRDSNAHAGPGESPRDPSTEQNRECDPRSVIRPDISSQQVDPAEASTGDDAPHSVLGSIFESTSQQSFLSEGGAACPGIAAEAASPGPEAASFWPASSPSGMLPLVADDMQRMQPLVPVKLAGSAAGHAEAQREAAQEAAAPHALPASTPSSLPSQRQTRSSQHSQSR